MERGASDDWGSCRFEVVVMMNFESVAPGGSLLSICSRREVTVVDGVVRRTKVDGRPRPLKVEIRTLRFSAIVTEVSCDVRDERDDIVVELKR